MSKPVNSLFSNIPSVDIKRSIFDFSHKLNTSFNVGELVPVEYIEVYPGDTFDIRASSLTRLSTLISPILDDLYLDVYFFFVPNRLVWEHWQEFCGQNTNDSWTQIVDYVVPQITTEVGFPSKSLADYFALPILTPCKVSALPFRAYGKIVNDWFYDQNSMSPAHIYVDDVDRSLEDMPVGTLPTSYVVGIDYGFSKFIAVRYHDYFSSVLPEPQKGPSVNLPLGDDAPVYSRSADHNHPGTILRWRSTDDLSPLPHDSYFSLNVGRIPNQDVFTSSIVDNSPFSTSTRYSMYPSNLYSDLSAATAVNVNQIRLMFQIQKFYERDARSGTRYFEILNSHFGVDSPDARLQRSEYLGGYRQNIQVNQVIQTGVSSSSPLGSTGAYSLSVKINNDICTKSFVEHGMIIGLACVRYLHSYDRGIEKSWSRRTKFDFYWPEFANIGEQPVLNKEIYAQGTDDDDGVFGYQEAFADLRYKQNRVTGLLRTNAPLTLSNWVLTDDYSSLPHLGTDWLQESKENVDRVLAVDSSESDQVILSINYNIKAYRPMPVHSVPGLLDHN